MSHLLNSLNKLSIILRSLTAAQQLNQPDSEAEEAEAYLACTRENWNRGKENGSGISEDLCNWLYKTAFTNLNQLQFYHFGVKGPATKNLERSGDVVERGSTWAYLGEPCELRMIYIAWGL